MSRALVYVVRLGQPLAAFGDERVISLAKRMVRNEFSIVMVGQVVQLVLTFGTSLIIARTIGAEGYGLINLARSIALVPAMIAPLGLDIALLKFCGRTDSADPVAQAVIRKLRLTAALLNIGVMLAVIVAALGSSFVNVFGHPGLDTIMLVTILTLPFAGDLSILGALYKARGEPARYAIFYYIGQSVLRVLMIGPVLLFWPSTLAVAFVNTAQIIMTQCLCFIDERRRHGRRPASGAPADRIVVRAEYWRVSREAVWMCASIVVYGTMRLADILVLGLYADTASIGEYAALSTVAQLIVFWSVAGSQTLGPRIANFYQQGDLDSLKRELSRYIRHASIISSFMFAGLAVFGDRLDLIFGKAFHFDPAVCFMLPLAFLLSATLAPMGYALSMTGHHRQENAILGSGALVLVVALLILVPRYGQIGAASSVVVAFGLVNVVRFVYTARLHGFIPGRAADLLPPFVGLALAFVARQIGDVFGGHDLLTTIGSSALFILLYVFVYRSELPLRRSKTT
ncbi:lipopolysaccharide biosynthesis protein [Methylobacterium sp. M6A4_1b]